MGTSQNLILRNVFIFNYSLELKKFTVKFVFIKVELKRKRYFYPISYFGFGIAFRGSILPQMKLKNQ